MGTPKMANRRASKRILKPVIEKKRRDRINQRLDELRTLLLDNTLDSRLQNPKLEKAEILELTVDYIRKRSSIGTESKDSNKDSLDVVAPLPTSRKPRLPCISIHRPNQSPEQQLALHRRISGLHLAPHRLHRLRGTISTRELRPRTTTPPGLAFPPSSQQPLGLRNAGAVLLHRQPPAVPQFVRPPSPPTLTLPHRTPCPRPRHPATPPPPPHTSPSPATSPSPRPYLLYLPIPVPPRPRHPSPSPLPLQSSTWRRPPNLHPAPDRRRRTGPRIPHRFRL
uniref:Hairy-related 1 n=1 Tax=Astyanax mexicanus TaxID=7994 RepID=A0A3B1JE21_ASTMX